MITKNTPSHQPGTFKLGISAALLSLSVSAGMSLAGTATMKASGGESTTFEYNDTMLRMGADANTYVIVRDNSMYAVINEDGNTMVIDAGSMMQSMASFAPQAMQTDMTGEILKLDKTGRTETIAGMKGDVYELQIKNEDGETETQELVLSDDKRAKEFRDALFLMMNSVMQMGTEDMAKAADDMQGRLRDMDLGVLRYGKEMEISSIDSTTVDPSRFELPAEPMNLNGIGAMLGGMMKEAEGDAAGATADDDGSTAGGGLFSSMMGALGTKADRQADRVGDTVEQEIDQETDEQVDKGIGKVFGKFFKR